MKEKSRVHNSPQVAPPSMDTRAQRRVWQADASPNGPASVLLTDSSALRWWRERSGLRDEQWGRAQGRQRAEEHPPSVDHDVLTTQCVRNRRTLARVTPSRKTFSPPAAIRRALGPRQGELDGLKMGTCSPDCRTVAPPSFLRTPIFATLVAEHT